MHDLTGKWLGRYRVGEKLGAGAMGEVYRARDAQLGRDIAIKVLPEVFIADQQRRARFEREARTAGQLNHPNILTVHDVGSVEDRPYLVTELLEGRTLREVGDSGPLGARQACELARQVAEGLSAAHAHGVIHRDIKPANLFLTDSEVVKILDFGLATPADPLSKDADSSHAPTIEQVTVAGTVLGTVGYMAPEQVRGEPADARSDVFAVGCVLYELVSGRRAFRAETAAETMTAILRSRPPKLVELQADGGPLLDPILDRCLAKDPARRYASASDLAADLIRLEAELQPVPRTGEGEPERPSVAVLPFVNLSADPEQEYFCDGVAEEIINALANVEGLRVVARTSSFAFKGRSEDVRTIGSQLDVGAVLEGSVRKSGDRLRITAQLIDVANGYHLWSERFDRRLEDVFAVQDEIALAVVHSLEVTLLGEEKAAITRRYTENLEVYNLYLEGLHHWNRLTPEGYEQSLERFDRVLALEPQFAPALVWKGIWYISQSFWADLPPVEGIAKARELAARTLAIEARNPLAHSLLGVVQSFFERDLVAAEASLRRSVELGPNQSSCHSNLAIHLLTTDRIDEAIDEAHMALRVDPLSVTTNTWVGTWLAHAGRLDEGLEQLHRTIGMHPNEWLPHHQLSEVLLIYVGDLEAARKEAQLAVELSGGISVALQQLAGVLYRFGNDEEADRIRRRLNRRAERSYVSPALRAHLALVGGDVEATLHLLRQADSCQDPWRRFTRIFLRSLPTLDARVEQLLDELGL